MIFRLHQPGFPLNRFIDNFLYYNYYKPTHNIDRFLPDGNVHIVMDLKETPQHIYDNYSLEAIQTCRRVWFSGIRNKFLTIPSGRDSEMFIINFHKGKAYPFANMPMHELTDHVVDGEQVSGGLLLELRDMLVSIPDIAGKFICAEQFLLKHFRNRLVDHPSVDFAVNTILKAPAMLSITSIADQVGFSQKHFISMFKAQVGMTPKSFMKLTRFQHAIQQIESSEKISWTSIAHESGYYDQAHFIHDFRIFSGFTPGQYLQNKNDQLNYVPVS